MGTTGNMTITLLIVIIVGSLVLFGLYKLFLFKIKLKLFLYGLLFLIIAGLIVFFLIKNVI
jgi:hypothetical protein